MAFIIQAVSLSVLRLRGAITAEQIGVQLSVETLGELEYKYRNININIECPTRDWKVPGSILVDAKKWMHVCKYLPLLSCVMCYIMCLIVVSVCTALSNSASVWLLTLPCWTTCILCVYSIIVYCPACHLNCNEMLPFAKRKPGCHEVMFDVPLDTLYVHAF